MIGGMVMPSLHRFHPRLIDALKDYGVRHLDMPATAPKIWSIIHAGQHKMAAE